MKERGSAMATSKHADESIAPATGTLSPREEASRCLLCHDAPCTAACPKKNNPAKFVRAVRFEREKGSLDFVKDCASCEGCDDGDGLAPCEKACIHYDFPVRIGEMREAVEKSGTAAAPTRFAEIDLSIDFCGVRCENPFFLSSSVVASGYDMCAAAFGPCLGW